MLKEQIQRYADHLEREAAPVTLRDLDRPHAHRADPTRRRAPVAALAGVAAVLLAIVGLAVLIMRAEDDSNRAVDTYGVQGEERVPRPVEPAPNSAEARAVLTGFLAELNAAGFRGELYGTPNAIVFGGTVPGLDGYTALLRVSTATAADRTELERRNDALDQRFRDTSSGSIEQTGDGAYGRTGDQAFPEEWLVRDVEGGSAELRVLVDFASPHLGRAQLAAALDDLSREFGRAGITPRAAAALPGGARVPAMPSPGSSALVGVSVKEIPGYEGPYGFAGWVEGRRRFFLHPVPSDVLTPAAWLPVHTLDGDLTGYWIPEVGGFIGIDLLSTPGFRLDELRITIPSTTTTTTEPGPPATSAPSNATEASPTVHHEGTYRGEERYASYTGRCPHMDHSLESTFVLGDGETWRFSATYCGTIRNQVWSGAGTFTIRTEDDATLTGTFTSSNPVPATGEPYQLNVTGGTQRFDDASGSCLLDNQVRRIREGLQEQFGSFVCDLDLSS